MGLKDGELVLDAGCGEGRHTLGACQRTGCAVYAVDIDEPSLKSTKWWLDTIKEEGKCNGSSHVLKGDVLHLPFKDGSFNKVVCSEVLEHVVDDDEAVKELVRVLMDGGVLAVSVPTYPTEAVYWRLAKDYSHPGGHIRIYKTRGLIDLLQRNGLQVYAKRRKHAFHSFYWLLRCVFGLNNDKAFIPSLYNKFLMRNVEENRRPYRLVEDVMNLVGFPLYPKSVAVYAVKKNESASTDDAGAVSGGSQ